MLERFVPMIHVSDVRATAEWYTSIGFKLVRYNEEDGALNWALLALGSSELMLNEGGKPSDAHRREVDLYIHTDNVVQVHASLKGRVQIVQDMYEAFYGMREFIIRDCNGFWITYGQPL